MISNERIIAKGENVRKRSIIIIAIAVFVLLLNQGVSAQKLGFRFKLSGGYDTFGIGDPNALLDASRSFLVNIGTFQEDAYGDPTEVVGEINKARKGGIGFGGEAIVTYSRFGFGLGLESLGSRSATSDLTLRLVDYPIDLVFSQIDGKYSVLALDANFYYFFGKSPLEYYVFAGPGLYFGKATWDYLFDDQRIVFGGYFEDQSIDVKDTGFGAQAGFGVDYELTPTIGLFAEGKVRFCKLKDWSGDEVWETTLGGPLNWSGELWYYEFYDFLYGTNGWYPYADIFEAGNAPSGDYARNGRAFEVDLTGLSIRAGIRFRF
jgi:hypothetical protein